MKLYKEELKQLMLDHPRSWHNVLKSGYRHILDDILANTPEIYRYGKIAMLVHVYLNDISQYPRCVVCGQEFKPTKADPIAGFTARTCGQRACANKWRYA